MLLLSAAIHQDIIQHNYGEAVQEGPQEVIHEGLERCWGIAKPETQDLELEMTIRGLESGLVLIPRCKS